MRWIAAAALSLVTLSAHATLITVDPTSYGLGANLSHVQDGLTISRLSWPDRSPFGAPLPPTRSDVYATSCIDNYYSCLSPEGLGFGGSYMVHEYEACVRGSSICGDTRALEFIFSDLTSDVSITFTWGSDPPTMLAYDIDGNLLDTCNNYSGACGSRFLSDRAYGSTISFNRDQRDIYRIVAGGFIGASFAHNMSYSVPEPSTLALMSLGLLGLGWRRRRLRRDPAPTN